MSLALKIDIHAHVYPNLESTLGKPTPARVLEMYEKAGIRGGIVLPLQTPKNPNSVLSPENAEEISACDPEHFAWFTAVNLQRPWDRDSLFQFLSEQKARGAKGVGEIVSKVYFDDPRARLLYSCCQELGLPMLFHVASSFECSYGVVDDPGLVRLEKMLAEYPDAVFIGHAKPFWCEISVCPDPAAREKSGKGPVTEGRLAELMRRYPNLYCDLSARSGCRAMMRDGAYAAKFLNEFSQRIFFGCDFCSLSDTYPMEFSAFLDELLETGAILPDTWENVSFRNAQRVFGLAPKEEEEEL